MTRKQFSLILCATCVALAGRGQSYSGGNAGSPGSPYPGAHPSTSRMMTMEVRASQLNGAPVRSLSEENLGTIRDVLLNPMTGRIDFAVIGLTSGTSPGQLTPVPWALLRPAAASVGSPGSLAPTGATPDQPSFIFNGPVGKLQGAPGFREDNWPALSDPGWRQGVLSYYGLNSAPGGYGTGSSPGSSRPNPMSPATPPPPR